MVLFGGMPRGHEGVRESWRLACEASDYVTDVVFEKEKEVILEAEKIYYPYMIWETKKKYIGRKYEDGPDVEPVISASGVELARRDNARLVRAAYQEVLETIMPLYEDPVPAAEMSVKVGEKLQEVVWRVVDDKLPVDDYIISKSLRATYKLPVPHSALADRIRARIASGEMVREPPKSGDRIPFVIATAESEKVVDKAEDPEWLVEKKIPLDRLYYLRKQLETPLTVLTSYFCDTKALFDKAHAEVWRQLAKNARITDFMPHRKGIVKKPSSILSAPIKKKRSAPQRTLGGGVAAASPTKKKKPPKPCSTTKVKSQPPLSDFFKR